MMLRTKSRKLAPFLLFLLMVAPNNLVRAQSKVDTLRTVRVLTFNIYHGETMKGDFDLDHIASVIHSVKPDFVALQEVDVHTERAKKMNICVELGLRTGLIPLFGKSMSFDGGYFGTGILSRNPIWKVQNHKLPGSEDREPRGALEALIPLQSGDTLRFVSTHLDYGKENRDRLEQAKMLNALFAQDDDGTPTILAGDLNALPNSPTMQLLYGNWKKSFLENVPTAPSKNPRAKIDYVLFRPANRWKVSETRVIDESLASDHRPVLSVLELLPE